MTLRYTRYQQDNAADLQQRLRLAESELDDLRRAQEQREAEAQP